MGIRNNLHPKTKPDGKKVIPHACYHLSRAETDMFLQLLKDVKFPDGYVSNISRGVNKKERKIQSLKSHDHHILMQDLLPIALRSCMTSKVVKVITDLSAIFKGVCSKTLNVEELERLESFAAMTLCNLEMIFPPSFFTIMAHLVIHIVGEAKVAGPVQYRWMYPIERCLKEFKSYVKNKAQPEGSIAERYIANECLTFCSRYLDGVEAIFDRPRRNPDVVELDEDKYLFRSSGKVLGGSEVIFLDEKTWTQVHRYVLYQEDEVTKFREEFMKMKKKEYPKKPRHALDKLVTEKFPEWFRMHVHQLREGDVSEVTKLLAMGPSKCAKQYKGMIINGIRFSTTERDKNKVTRNNGVVVKSQTTSYSSVRDKLPVSGDVDYFGKLTNIYELDYGQYKVIVFRCDWVDVNRGVKKDQFGFKLVNFSRLSHTGDHITDDPFILSSQAQQALYVEDLTDPGWSVALKLTVRDAFDVGEYLSEGLPRNITQLGRDFEENEWVRTDIEEEIYADD